MLLPLALALVRADPAARLDAYLKAHPSFLATFSAGAGGPPLVAGTLRVARPDRLRLDARGNGLDYTAVSTPATVLELDRIEKVYDQHPPIGGMRLYESRISGALGFLPRFLLAASVKGVFGNLKVEPVGEGEMRATVQTQMGPAHLRLLVDPQGRPTLFASKGPDGTREWRISAIERSPADSPAFRVVPPTGYVPHALPDLPAPLAIGQAAPLTGWRKGGATIDLKDPRPGAPRLLAVLGTDCAPSRAARPFLIDLGRTMPVMLIEKDGIADPSGRLMARLSPPGTPMFYLVGADGKVRKLWFGFEAAKGAAWEAEVREAAK